MPSSVQMRNSPSSSPSPTCDTDHTASSCCGMLASSHHQESCWAVVFSIVSGSGITAWSCSSLKTAFLLSWLYQWVFICRADRSRMCFSCCLILVSQSSAWSWWCFMRAQDAQSVRHESNQSQVWRCWWSPSFTMMFSQFMSQVWLSSWCCCSSPSSSTDISAASSQSWSQFKWQCRWWSTPLTSLCKSTALSEFSEFDLWWITADQCHH